MNQPVSGPQASASASFRWIVLAFVVSATTINYLDRQIIALLKPLLEDSFGWSDRDYGHVVSAFQFSAAMAYLGAGWFVDRIGVRWGYALAVGVWSLAGMAHAAARSVLDFVVARVALGISEAANTPVAVKSIAEWFPLRERALALGFMNSGSNLGAIITPLVVPGLALTFGWQMAFIVTGGLGFVWLLAWVAVYRTHRSRQRVTVEIAIDRAPVPWRMLLRDRRTWAVAGAKLLTDPVWWFLLFWLPDFLHRQFALDLRTFGPPLAAVY
ncbi:MAG: MFS transporter, partial [Steroidobacteraceae bacterium]